MTHRNATGYFEMPATYHSALLNSLLKKWMALLGSSSWLMASIGLVGLFYGIFFGLSLFDKSSDNIEARQRWAKKMIHSADLAV